MPHGFQDEHVRYWDIIIHLIVHSYQLPGLKAIHNGLRSTPLLANKSRRLLPDINKRFPKHFRKGVNTHHKYYYGDTGVLRASHNYIITLLCFLNTRSFVWNATGFSYLCHVDGTMKLYMSPWCWTKPIHRIIAKSNTARCSSGPWILYLLYTITGVAQTLSHTDSIVHIGIVMSACNTWYSGQQ